MRTFNRVTLLGRLGGAPELIEAKNGNRYVRLRVATDRLRKEDGHLVLRKDPDWHSVFVWGPQADRCAEYLGKGSLVLVEGQLSYWTDSAAEKKIHRSSITADLVQFIEVRHEAPVRLDNPDPALNPETVAHPA